jgi:uncharacterized repeat protein (TIGR02543 family)
MMGLILGGCSNPAGGGGGGSVFTVTFNADGGSPAPQARTVASGDTITQPEGVIRSGHTLDGWYTDAAFTNLWNFATDTVNGSMTLYAKWMPNPLNTFTVTFIANGGSPAPADRTVAKGGTVTEPAAMSKSGYSFKGWYTEAVFTNLWNFAADTVTAAVTLYAKWTPDLSDQFFTFTVETTLSNETFSIPVSGYLNGDSTVKSYDWNIDWGDGQTETAAGSSSSGSNGIGHTYASAGRYSITIRPNGAVDAWFGAFGFRSGSSGANIQDNKNKVVSVDSPLQPLMTRTQAQLSAGTAPDYEWAYTFYHCTNLTMGAGFGFSSAWDSITTVDESFAAYMFAGCNGDAFTMNDGFNLPQGITTVGIAGSDFAAYMFAGCNGDAFTMNSVFNLPQGITTAGDDFAAYMFSGCNGDAFTMNSVFNLPQGITTVGIAGSNFATGMFARCNGDAFTMNSVFNLPQGITIAGGRFAYEMFNQCKGTAFTMNSVFNLPQGIITVDKSFAYYMFYQCSGDAFTMNSVFNLPQGITTAGDNFAASMFFYCSGDAFTMNSVFNLPQGITVAEDYFAYSMFSGCSGDAFTMNSVFNLPKDITTAEDYFAYSMFSGCSGDAFTMNSVFNLPKGITAAANNFADSMFTGCSGDTFQVNTVFKFPALSSLGTNAFSYTFHLGYYMDTLQTRTAASIINGNAAPSSKRNTFGPASGVWSDYAEIDANWQQ